MKNIGKILKGSLIVETSLPDIINISLREKGVISEQEVVLKVGDLLVAYNVITQKRRKLQVTEASITESTRTLLKG